MEEPLPVAESTPEAPQPRTTSLFVRMLNVFAVPSEVFEEVRLSPHRLSNWLVPALLLATVTVATAFVLFSQPDIQKKAREGIAKVLEQQVKAGNTTERDAANMQDFLEKVAPPGVIVFTAGLGFARIFWWAFILWIFGLTFLKSRFPFSKGLEVAGLGLMVGVLGSIVTLLLMVDIGEGMKFTISDAAINRRAVLISGAANVCSIWLLIVMSTGLSRLANVPFLRAAWLVFAYWVLQQTFFLLLQASQGAA